MDLHLDIETFSAAPLKKCGLYRYAEDPSTDILCAVYAFDDGPLSLWVPVADLPRQLATDAKALMKVRGGTLHLGPLVPKDLRAHIEAGGKVKAHNAAFERENLNGEAGSRLNFPKISIEQCECTMAMAAAHSLPQSLGEAAKALGTAEKQEKFKQWMLQLSKPRKPTKDDPRTRWTPDMDEERFLGLYDYCCDDVLAERGLDSTIKPLSPYEQKIWFLDQRINSRGLAVDLESVGYAQKLIVEYKKVLEGKCIEICGLKPSQTEALAVWIREVGGYDIANLQMPTMLEAIDDPYCPKVVRSLLKIRSYHAMKSVMKYTAIERATCADGILRGMFAYHAAATGRWASRIVQLQNLFRGVLTDPDLAIDIFRSGSLEMIEMLYSQNPLKVLASAIRGMFIAKPGHDLLCLDYSSIEARFLAWLADQEDVLDVFRTHGKIYEYQAAKIYRIDMGAVTKDQRFIGKVAVLALGYQGGKNAFAKMAKNYGVDIPEAFAEQIKVDWRAANQKVVGLWYELEALACTAVLHPGKIYALKNRKIMFCLQGDFLYMRLPSGRRIAYHKPQLDSEGKLTYLGVDTYTRKYGRVKTYGGKLAENACQGGCRDLVANGMVNLEDEGYPPIGHVHDEAITEPPEGFGSVAEAAEIMCRLPRWAKGLPVSAAGFRAKRYRKD